ncbi:MAG: transporter substrate-binding domain-containing protein [Peptostreptococcaceae bacterium]
MKKIIKLALGVIISTSMVGCTLSNDGNDSSNKNKLEEIKERGTLMVATSAEYPPYEFHEMIDGKDTIIGLDAMIAKDIADEIGVELEFVDMDFDGVLGAINADKADIVLAGMTATDERKENANFSEPYYFEKNRIIVRKGDEGIAIADTKVAEDIHQGSAVAFKKDDGNKELIEVVNKVLKELNDSGKIDEYMDEARKLAKK